MTDFVLTTAQLISNRGYGCPRLNINYIEKGTDAQWFITAGGTRCYLVKTSHKTIEGDVEDNAADSHFMARRLTTALLYGGAGLFNAQMVGRQLFRGVEGSVTWSSHLEIIDPDTKTDAKVVADIEDWYGTIVGNNMLRRAADDTHLALNHPDEALVFVYRGLEWLKIGQSLSWEDVAKDIGCTAKDLDDLKRLANPDGGVRHANKNGVKLRTDVGNYSSWVCALVDAVISARVRLGQGYVRPDAKCSAGIVMKAVKSVAYA